jgi:uncharacterized membrane protein
LDTRDVSLTAVFAGLYTVVNIVQTMLGGPLTFGPVQLRVADCLIPLAALLGWPVTLGVTIGALLSNAFYWLDPLDVILGPIANLIAATAILVLRKHRLLACVIGALPIGIIVGGYLWLFFPPPEILGFAPIWAAMIISITASSLVTLGIIGYGLLAVLSRPNIIGPLKAHGLKVLTED